MSRRLLVIALSSLVMSSCLYAQDTEAPADSAKIAEKLSNPVASLISVPLQFNDDTGIGPTRSGHKVALNIQPVIPVPLSDDWNMISRTILPVVSQSDIAPGTSHQFGVGDITQSLFFSPRKPTADGVIWGIGPAILIPTASNDLLGGHRWGVGPTALVLRQAHGITAGFLANQIWSIARTNGHVPGSPISMTFVQPFLSYNTPAAWTYGLNLESSYDWHQHEYTVPLNLSVSKVTRLGRLPVSFGGGARYWLASTEGGPHGWGFRFTVTAVFPE